MMYYIAALLLTLISTAVIAKQNGPVGEDPWPTYGYIALGAIILVVVIVVLIRRQYRKFNE